MGAIGIEFVGHKPGEGAYAAVDADGRIVKRGTLKEVRTLVDGRLSLLIEEAFGAICEAEKIIYAAGLPREVKDRIIAAHSAVLALKHDSRVRTSTPVGYAA